MTFKDWLQSELHRRSMSQREFAKKVGLSSASISRCLNEKDPRQPGLDVLLAVSKGTNTSLLELVRLAYPELVEETSLSPDAAILAQRIVELPDDLRLAVESIIQRG